MTNRTAIIGDVHGLTQPLKSLVETLALREGDTLVFVGDLLDKGPDPAGTLTYAASLAAQAPFEVALVEGNHEDRHRRYQRNLLERPGVAAKQSAAEPQLPALADQITEAGRDFLAAAIPFWRHPHLDILVVHGGIPADLEDFPESAEAFAALRGKAKSQASKILRTRFVNAKTGGFLALGKERPGDPFWAEIYDGRFGHVVFGHQPFLDGPAHFKHATGIDTGAVHGGALTALVLSADGARRYVQTPGLEYKPFKSDRGLSGRYETAC